MQRESIKILIVEDDPTLSVELASEYRDRFEELFQFVQIDTIQDANEARKIARRSSDNPYDFVSLDVNLGDRFVTGLDVLDTFRRFESAWMVAVVTGAEEDKNLDCLVGAEKGESIRNGLRSIAYSKFPSERLMLVEKPSMSIPESERSEMLKSRIFQIVSLFQEIDRQRYIFRPIQFKAQKRLPKNVRIKTKRRFYEVDVKHWQIRFGCGELRTLPDMAGFATLHLLLKRQYKEPITPEESLLVEPKKEAPEKEIQIPESTDPVDDWFKERGVDFEIANEQEREQLIRAALSVHFKRYIELRELEIETEELTLSEFQELKGITGDLGPLADIAENYFIRMYYTEENHQNSMEQLVHGRDGFQYESGIYEKKEGRLGLDSSAAALFRARMKRVKDALRENGYSNFAEHLEQSLHSTGASWSYHPSPKGKYNWTT